AFGIPALHRQPARLSRGGTPGGAARGQLSVRGRGRILVVHRRIDRWRLGGLVDRRRRVHRRRDLGVGGRERLRRLGLVQRVLGHAAPVHAVLVLRRRQFVNGGIGFAWIAAGAQ